MKESKIKYAGFWKRFAAALIDGLLIAIVFNVLGGSSQSEWLKILIGLTYYAGMESSSKQGTLGKMAMGIIVTDYNYKRISVARALGRYFAKLVSLIILFIGFLMVIWTRKKQALHDIIAETYVITKQ